MRVPNQVASLCVNCSSSGESFISHFYLFISCNIGLSLSMMAMPQPESAIELAQGSWLSWSTMCSHSIEGMERDNSQVLSSPGSSSTAVIGVIWVGS